MNDFFYYYLKALMLKSGFTIAFVAYCILTLSALLVFIIIQILIINQ